jgi:hypothetical protein
MRSLTTRLIIVIASVLIAIIIGMQVHWLSKTYAYEKNEFNTSVLKAIRGVYEDLPLLYNVNTPLESLAERPNENTFLFRVDSIPAHDSLMEHISAELEDFHVFTDYQVGLYDLHAQKFIFEEYVSADASRKNEGKGHSTPAMKRSFNYVSLYFPARAHYLIGEMRTWIYSSAVLLLLLIAFSFSIYTKLDTPGKFFAFFGFGR